MAINGDVNVSYNIEYRSKMDDAWYSSGLVLHDGKQLRVKFKDFEHTANDEVFSIDDFTTHQAVEEFFRRFRLVSIPVEDKECSRVIEGMTVCATYTGDGSVRFFDAIVDAVLYKEHSPENCQCTYLLFWQHGPAEGQITAASIDNICLIIPGPVDPRVTDFTNLAKEKIRGASSQSSLIAAMRSSSAFDTKGPFLSRKDNSNQSQNKLQDMDIAGHISFGGISEGRGRFYPPESDHDRDMGGVKKTGCHHYIILENLEKDLSPSVMAEFIHGQTSTTAQAYVFQSLSAETYARGAIVSDSRRKLKRIYDFISNPNHFIVSLTGRPWVIVEDTLGTGTSKRDLWSLQPRSENMDTERKPTIVRLGTEEYVRAKQLKDLFMQFRNHINGLLKTLDTKEKKIMHPTHAN